MTAANSPDTLAVAGYWSRTLICPAAFGRSDADADAAACTEHR